ncbi:MAG: hypothetical protein FWE67_05310 [Planctomycetaceae bacterium]|nr:hypothetical protein [Planctomycetaceae bacterium]
MNSRERVLAAVNHQQTDRVPRNFWAEPAAWNRLFEFLKHQNKQQLLDYLDIDIRVLESVSPPEKEIGNGIFQNFWGERYVYRQTAWGLMREDLAGALAEAQTFEEIASFDFPNPESFDYSGFAAQLRQYEGRAILYGFADIWQRPSLVRGMSNMFIDMGIHSEWAHFLSRKFTDFYKKEYANAMEAANGKIDLFLLISDLGTQRGPMISKKMFAEFVAPYIKEMCDCIHSLGAKVLYHSCGNIRPFITGLIDAGVDILDPIQPVAEMQPEQLKAEYGGQLCFHGGIDMQRILPLDTPEEVRAESQRYQKILGQDGGYILAPAHLFQPDVPPENILAVYR